MIARTLLLTAAAFALAACGDLGASLEEAKQGAADIAQETLEAGMGAVDTQTACMLAGQSEAFCGCVAERLGPDLTSEHLDALRAAVAASVNGEGPPASSESAEPLDAATRQALVQCATRAAIDGAVGDAGN
ncbi:hypothetical protein U91I_00621 [alpha proteobacterium U9-1i]|nr:hypothetical protein U91I_00621 [alpha proteobacterium U9-1i]